MIYLRQKPKGPPPPGTWVINKDSPQAQGLVGWWVAAGTRVVAPDFSGRKLHGAGGSACTAVSNDLGPAIQTNDNDVTNGYIDCGGFRLPVGTTEYSAMLDTVPLSASSTHRFFGIGQHATGTQYTWGGAYLSTPVGSVTDTSFFPLVGSSVTSSGRPITFGQRLHWVGAYKSGVRTSQYVNGKLNGNSTTISGTVGTTHSLRIGAQWDAFAWPMQFREARIYNRFITEQEAADWYGENRWDLYYELGRRTFFTVPAAGGGEGQVVEVGLVSETDTALGVSWVKRKAIGLAAETDAALGLSAAKRKAAGLATEADTAFAVAALKRRTAGLATEFDSALAVAGASKAKEIGLATETDTALQAVVVASGQIIPVGLAEETDTALGLTAAKKKAVGLATETDSALAVAAAKRKAAGLAAETDSALALGTTTKVKEIGLAIELDRALAATVVGGVEPEPEEEVGRSRSGMIVTPGRLMNP